LIPLSGAPVPVQRLGSTGCWTAARDTTGGSLEGRGKRWAFFDLAPEARFGRGSLDAELPDRPQASATTLIVPQPRGEGRQIVQDASM
jgi:hypothetical protein